MINIFASFYKFFKILLKIFKFRICEKSKNFFTIKILLLIFRSIARHQTLKKKNLVLKKKFLSKTSFSREDWFSQNYIHWINAGIKYKLINKNFNYLELGVYEGRSAIFIIQNFKKAKLTLVDPWKITNSKDLSSYSNKSLANVYQLFKKSIKPYRSKVKVYKKTSEEFFLINKKKFDLIYLDACHHKNEVFNDLVGCFHISKKKTLIIIDDIWKIHNARIKDNVFFGFLEFHFIYKNKYKILSFYPQLIIIITED